MSIQTIEIKSESEQQQKFRSGLVPHLFKELSLFKCDSLNEMIKWEKMIEDRQAMTMSYKPIYNNHRPKYGNNKSFQNKRINNNNNKNSNNKGFS